MARVLQFQAERIFSSQLPLQTSGPHLVLVGQRRRRMLTLQLASHFLQPPQPTSSHSPLTKGLHSQLHQPQTSCTNIGLAFSTTSASYFSSLGRAVSTTSASNYFRIGLAVSTTTTTLHSPATISSRHQRQSEGGTNATGLTISGGATTTGSILVQGIASSTFTSGINAFALNLTGSATSTAANGFNLAAGCFAINGTCLATSNGTAASTTCSRTQILSATHLPY